MSANWDEAAHQKYIKYMEQFGIVSTPSGKHSKKEYYYVYVPESKVPLFTANNFEAYDKDEYPPIVGKQLMRLPMNYHLSQSSFIKRILKFYQEVDIIIPEQHKNSKRWNNQ